jgi:hypothetical protein
VLFRSRGFLRFASIYHAHTFPGVLASVPSFRGGKIIWTTRTVHHPGTKARGFSRMIQVKYEKDFKRLIYNAVRRGIYKANRS